MKKLIVLPLLAVLATAATPAYAWGPPPPRHHHHHHHHHRDHDLAVGAGILGAGLLAATVFEATRPDPAPVVVQQPVVVPQQPVVVQQPAPVVVQQAAPVVVQEPQVQTTTRTRQIWVEGRYVEQPDGTGGIVRVWQPGHYETVTEQVPVY